MNGTSLKYCNKVSLSKLYLPQQTPIDNDKVPYLSSGFYMELQQASTQPFSSDLKMVLSLMLAADHYFPEHSCLLLGVMLQLGWLV